MDMKLDYSPEEITRRNVQFDLEYQSNNLALTINSNQTHARSMFLPRGCLRELRGGKGGELGGGLRREGGLGGRLGGGLGGGLQTGHGRGNLLSSSGQVLSRSGSGYSSNLIL